MKTIGKYSVGDIVVHCSVRFVIKDLKEELDPFIGPVIYLYVQNEIGPVGGVWVNVDVFHKHIPKADPVFTTEADYYKWLSERLT